MTKIEQEKEAYAPAEVSRLVPVLGNRCTWCLERGGRRMMPVYPGPMGVGAEERFPRSGFLRGSDFPKVNIFSDLVFLSIWILFFDPVLANTEVR